jgi:DNA-binding NarL/FixJ family response regulator
MGTPSDHFDQMLASSGFDTHFNVFHDLMRNKVGDVLLVSSPYDAYIMEEDGSLASKIINEYSGLNLSRPPRIFRASSAKEAFALNADQVFDLVITMPNLEDMDPFDLGLALKDQQPELPVILLAHSTKGLYSPLRAERRSGIDQVFIWSGDSDLLLALVKSVEDRLNAAHDTQKASVRVLLLVEDSPLYRSFFLPLLYREVVNQTQSVLEEGLNEEHRLLKMRARPKVLIAEDYEQALALYNRYEAYILGIISDTRFPRKGRMTDDAGFQLLSRIHAAVPHLPLLLMSSQPANRAKAAEIPASFIDKNQPDLAAQIDAFFLEYLGFGDFVFRQPDGSEVARASNLEALERILPQIPDEPLAYHAQRHKFSNWLMARSEIAFASQLRKVHVSDFENIAAVRQYLIKTIHALRKWRQKGVVVHFRAKHFDPDISDFMKIGGGSMGGKARGLAFMSNLIQASTDLHQRYPAVSISIPRTLVITTDGFEAFLKQNLLASAFRSEASDAEITRRFLKADLPHGLEEDLIAFLAKVKGPMSVRSSSLLEDAYYQPYTGLYKTFMIPNNHSSFKVRLDHLLTAIKLVYASVYFKAPTSFTTNIARLYQRDRMAVIVQQLVGQIHGEYYYPAISGIASSHNFYPVGHLKAEDGVAHIALGMGKTVTEGEQALRFSPRYPSVLPQFTAIEDILANAQRFFYALQVKGYPDELYFHRGTNLERREISLAENDFPIKALSSMYFPEEHRIRDTSHGKGQRVLTFAAVLKHQTFPLPQILADLIDLGHKGVGRPVEFEFSVNLHAKDPSSGDFYVLQARPMAAGETDFDIRITARDIQDAFCYSTASLGNGKNAMMADIVYVRPDRFDPAATVEIAGEIGRLNARLVSQQKPYLLVGPGRWGSKDRWLGIPVKWHDISGVGAMVELRNAQLSADPSQGSHFFQQMTSQGIHYLTITEGTEAFFDWERVQRIPAAEETRYLRHVTLPRPFILKNDGRHSQCIMRFVE